MKKLLPLAAVFAMAHASLFAQNVGVGEPNPSSKLSVKGNLSVGSTFSSETAPANGAIIEGTVGIGTANPNSMAILDLSGSNKGFILPRMTSAERAAVVNPPDGMLVFDMDLNQVYSFNHTQWFGMSTSTGVIGATGPEGLQGIQGEPGPAGINGMDGANGAPGAQGATGPAGVMGATGATGPQGITGANGTNGTNGATWLTGSAAPTGGQGVTNDFYLRSSNGTYYKKINTSTWASQGSLKGATGSTGATGVAGTNGTNGATGATGPTGTVSLTGVATFIGDKYTAGGAVGINNSGVLTTYTHTYTGLTSGKKYKIFIQSFATKTNGSVTADVAASITGATTTWGDITKVGWQNYMMASNEKYVFASWEIGRAHV